MKQKNALQEKSYSFALLSITIYKSLIRNHKEYIIGRQFLKSCTSIGANVEEALGAQSRREFRSKISTSYKEARESKYWIRLLTDSRFITDNESKILLDMIEELLKILGSIQKTLQSEATVNNTK